MSLYYCSFILNDQANNSSDVFVTLWTLCLPGCIQILWKITSLWIKPRFQQPILYFPDNKVYQYIFFSNKHVCAIWLAEVQFRNFIKTKNVRTVGDRKLAFLVSIELLEHSWNFATRSRCGNDYLLQQISVLLIKHCCHNQLCRNTKNVSLFPAKLERTWGRQLVIWMKNDVKVHLVTKGCQMAAMVYSSLCSRHVLNLLVVFHTTKKYNQPDSCRLSNELPVVNTAGTWNHGQIRIRKVCNDPGISFLLERSARLTWLVKGYVTEALWYRKRRDEINWHHLVCF